MGEGVQFRTTNGCAITDCSLDGITTDDQDGFSDQALHSQSMSIVRLRLLTLLFPSTLVVALSDRCINDDRARSNENQRR